MRIRFTKQNKNWQIKNVRLNKWYKCEFVRNCGEHKSHIDIRNDIGECSRIYFNDFCYELIK